MQNKIDNVLVICTSRNLEECYRRVLGGMNVEIDVEYIGPRFGTDMDASLSYVRSFREKGKDILVSRGFYAQELRKLPEFRVIDIPISAQDVLKVLLPYAGKDILMGVVECRSFVNAILPVAELLGIRTVSYIVEGIEDFYTLSKKAAEDGVDVICGGAMKYYDQFFQNLGVQFESIETSEETIRTNLMNVLALCELVDEEKRKRGLVETLINVSDTGTIAIGHDSRIISMNRKASEITGLDRTSSVGMTLQDAVDTSSAEDLAKILNEDSGIYNLQGKRVLVDLIETVPDDSGADRVIKLRTADEIIEDDSRVRNILTKKGFRAHYTVNDILGSSTEIQQLKSEIKSYARADSTVLITGESGTGKELVAQAIHNESVRSNKPFLAINCSAFQPALLESELFGYAPGSFTGAKKTGKVGLFEMAHTGTIFLDEIGEMDFSMQAKLLRVLQEKEFMRIGDDKIVRVDVRVIAATNRKLFQEVLEGQFREDLYYRLNVLQISVPPLRDHKSDIPLLIDTAIDHINDRFGSNITGVEDVVYDQLKEYDWHGNVRELNSFAEKMCAVVRNGMIRMREVAPLFRQLDDQAKEFRQFAAPDEIPYGDCNLKEAEHILIERALKRSGYNKTKAAKLLGIDRVTLNRKLKEKD